MKENDTLNGKGVEWNGGGENAGKKMESNF